MSNSSAEAAPPLADFESLFVNNTKLQTIAAFLNRFNPIRVMKMERQEIRHSAILSWLLDPNESHGLGDKFLRAFLGEALRGRSAMGSPDALDIGRADLRGTIVRREWLNIDIFIYHPANRWGFVIENKFDSKQREGQLSGYIEKVSTALQKDDGQLTIRGIFLTLLDEEPQYDRYAPIGYDAICAILPDLIQREQHLLTNEVRTFLEHYLEMLKEELGVNEDRNRMEKLARELYRDHRHVLNFIIENGANSDFAIAIQSICGDEPDFATPVTLDDQSFHFDWIGNDRAPFLHTAWYKSLGMDRFSWDGCEDWWFGYPVATWFQLAFDADGTGGRLSVYAEIGPIAKHEFRAQLIEKLQAAATKAGTRKIKFQTGAAEDGRRYSKFFKLNVAVIEDVQNVEEIAEQARKLLKKLQPEFELVAGVLSKFQKFGTPAE